jgi:hypothetical protein
MRHLQPTRLRTWHQLCSLAIAATVVLGLEGYVVAAPVPPRYIGEPVAFAPPPPQVEVIGVAPVLGYVWIGGYWNWVGGRHVWVAGRWEAPRAGYYWEPHVWAHTAAGWHLREGHWVRR